MNPRMQGFERDSLTAVLHSKRVWLTHVIVNALLIVSFFYWTRIPDETRAQFVLTVIGGILIAFVVLWLHCSTFDHFRCGSTSSFRAALRRTVARVPAFLVWAVIFGCVLWLIGNLWDYHEQAGGWARHGLPGFLRRGVSPRSMISAASAIVWFLFYFFWPIIFIPVGAEIASRGLRGFFSPVGFRPLRELRFWILYAICFLIGAYIPYKLVWMTPTRPSPLRTEEISMAFRFGVAYLLLVTAWIVLCAAIVRVLSATPPARTASDTAA